MRYVIALTALLAGCISPQEAAFQERHREWQRQQAAQNYWSGLQAQCAGIGYQPNTDAHRGCVMQLHQTEEQRRAALGAAVIGSGMLNPKPIPQQPVYQIPRQRTTNCYTDSLGYTRCTHN